MVIQMKKLISTLAIVAILAVAVLSVGAVANAAVVSGPAPNYQDGVSDGSGLDSPFGDQSGVGPAPNSGDGIPDGSGF